MLNYLSSSVKHSSSSPVLGSHPYASRSTSNLSRSTEDTAAPPTMGIMMPKRKSGLVPPGLLIINLIPAFVFVHVFLLYVLTAV